MRNRDVCVCVFTLKFDFEWASIGCAGLAHMVSKYLSIEAN